MLHFLLAKVILLQTYNWNPKFSFSSRGFGFPHLWYALVFHSNLWVFLIEILGFWAAKFPWICTFYAHVIMLILLQFYSQVREKMEISYALAKSVNGCIYIEKKLTKNLVTDYINFLLKYCVLKHTLDMKTHSLSLCCSILNKTHF